jgi:ABC-2 type transport system permease protein
MRKNITIAKAEWLDAIQSYQEVILWIIIQSVPILIMGVLWSSSRSFFSTTQISYLVSYYVLIFVIDRLTSFYFEQKMQDEIREGTFSRYLLKPISVQKYLLWDNIGGKGFNTLFLLLPILGIISIIFSGNLIFPGLTNFGLFLASLTSAFFIQFSLALLVTSGAFFIEQAFAINHLHWMLDAVAGGYMLPLTFYPQILQNLFSFLPFSFVYYIPVSIYTGQFSTPQALQKIGFSVAWAVFLYFLSVIVWRIGIKKYSSVGG